MAVYRITSGARRVILYASLVVASVLAYLFLFSGTRHNQIPNYAPLRKTSSASNVAIATFLSGAQDESEPLERDAYFQAVRTLTYQLLHDPATKSARSNIPFLVLCTKDVSLEKRRRLELDGATIEVVVDVPLPYWVSTGVTRWADQFTKLRIFEMVEYERVLFIDADTLLTASIDGIFEELMIRTPMTTLYGRGSKAVRSDELPLPSNYTFAARSDNAFSGERDHPFPPPSTASFSAGFWVAAPSREMFAYLMSVMRHWRRFDPHTMEQSLLNYAFRREGAMPWFELAPEWSATWPSERDVDNGVRSLHEKWWTTGPEVLRTRWDWTQARMVEFQKGRE